MSCVVHVSWSLQVRLLPLLLLLEEVLRLLLLLRHRLQEVEVGVCFLFVSHVHLFAGPPPPPPPPGGGGGGPPPPPPPPASGGGWVLFFLKDSNIHVSLMKVLRHLLLLLHPVVLLLRLLLLAELPKVARCVPIAAKCSPVSVCCLERTRKSARQRVETEELLLRLLLLLLVEVRGFYGVLSMFHGLCRSASSSSSAHGWRRSSASATASRRWRLVVWLFSVCLFICLQVRLLLLPLLVVQEVPLHLRRHRLVEEVCAVLVLCATINKEPQVLLLLRLLLQVCLICLLVGHVLKVA
jgi:hypothetical protein